MSGFNVIVSLVGHRFTHVTVVTRSVRIIVLTYQAFVTGLESISIEYVPLKFTICCALYVCVCVFISAFRMQETKLTDENEYEKRGVIGLTASRLSNLGGIEGWD